jgi:two-component system, LuxR family, response regulator FixJ
MATEPIVFVVDDDPAARDSVVVLVKSKGVRVASYASAEEFLADFDPAQGGCLVVDVRMTGMGGLELQEALAERNSRLPVIVITGFGDVPTAVRAMQAGASTFLEKPCRAPELWAAIQRALGESIDRNRDVERLSDTNQRLGQLTAEERQVLRMMLAGRTNKAIAAELDSGLRTVELRRSNIMKKMHSDSFADLVRQILALGDAAGDLRP